jgi:hypothetical protein
MQRPTAVSIFGILNIVFGFLALFGVSRTFGVLALQDAPDDSKNPIVRIMHEIPAYATLVKWTIPPTLLSFALLLIAGIGLLRMGEWARKLSIAYGIYAILIAIAEAAATFVFVFRPLFAQASHADGSSGSPELAALIGAIMGGVYVLIYPVALIFYLTRPEIAAEFRPPAQPSVLPEA